MGCVGVGAPRRQLAASLARNPKLRHMLPSGPASASTSHTSAARSGSTSAAGSEVGEECASPGLRRVGSVGAAAKRRLADMQANGELIPADNGAAKRPHLAEASDSDSDEDTTDTVPFSVRPLIPAAMLCCSKSLRQRLKKQLIQDMAA